MSFFRTRLANGSTFVGEVREQDKGVALGIGIPVGSAHDPKGKGGAAHFLEHVLFKPQTGSGNRIEKIARLEMLGARVNALTDFNHTLVECDLPAAFATNAWDVLCGLVQKPNPSRVDFGIEKEVVLEEILMGYDNPDTRMTDFVVPSLYNSSLGHSIIGDLRSVNGLTAKDLTQFWTQAYHPSRFVFSAVGRFSPTEFQTYLSEHIARMKSPPLIDLKQPVTEKRYHPIAQRIKGQQAQFAIGLHTPLPSEIGSEAVVVLDNILTDAMSSDLFVELREKRGLTYGPDSVIDASRIHGAYGIYAASSPQKFPTLKKVLIETVRGVKSVSQRKFAQFKERAIYMEEIEEDTRMERMESLAIREIMGMGAETRYNLAERLKSVTRGQVIALASQPYSTVNLIP